MPFYRLGTHSTFGCNDTSSLLNTACKFSSWGCWSKMRRTVLFSFQLLPGDNKIRRPSSSIWMVGFPDSKPQKVNVYWLRNSPQCNSALTAQNGLGSVFFASADLYHTQLRYIFIGNMQIERTIRLLLAYSSIKVLCTTEEIMNSQVESRRQRLVMF